MAIEVVRPTEAARPPGMAYVGLKRPCGCIVFMSHDEPESDAMRSFNAIEVAILIRRGYVVERVSVAEAGKLWERGPCPH